MLEIGNCQLVFHKSRVEIDPSLLRHTQTAKCFMVMSHITIAATCVMASFNLFSRARDLHIHLVQLLPVKGKLRPYCHFRSVKFFSKAYREPRKCYYLPFSFHNVFHHSSLRRWVWSCKASIILKMKAFVGADYSGVQLLGGMQEQFLFLFWFCSGWV